MTDSQEPIACVAVSLESSYDHSRSNGIACNESEQKFKWESGD